jgi:putative hemolysin
LSISFVGFLLVSLILDWILTAVRASLLHARLPRLLDMRERFPQTAERTLNLLESATLRTALRIAMVLVHFVLAVSIWLVFVELTALQASSALALAVLVVTAILVLASEFALEGLVHRAAEDWAMRLTWLGRLLDRLLWPLSSLMQHILGPMGTGQHQLSNVTEDELRSWVEEEPDEGGLEQGERRMIYSIFQFGDTLVREIMVPRIDVLALDAETSLLDAIGALAGSGHSRVPVYVETVDNIVGILYAKDMLRARLESDQADPIRSLCRPPYFVPEAKKVDELLREMQSRRVHMAIVVDEYGGTAGMVTLEDIVEEIVGEIQDEYDVAEEKLYQRMSEDEFSFQGRINLDDFNDILGTHLAKDNADTLAGYVYGEIGKVPTGGEQIAVEDWTLTVDQVTGRRIRRITARRLRPSVVEPQEKKDDTER